VYFSKIKNISIALCLVLLPMVAAAAGLGQMKVASGIGEPFRATIDLLSATSDELSTIKASLAPEEDYLAQGIERTADQKNIKINVGNDANGKKVIKLSSSQPISEPYVDMLVVLEWGNGRIIRQYTALLDPPEYKREVSKPTPPATNSFDNTSVNNSTSNIKKSGAPKATALAKRTTTKEHLTRSGDTLSKIARRMRPDGVSLDRILVALFEANPEAFVDSNMNRLKVGKILQAPSEEALSAVTRKKAVKEIKLQTADWNKYRNKLAAAIAKRTPAASNEDTQSSSGKIKSAATDQSAPKSKTPKDVVKLSTGGADAKDASMQAKMTALQEEVSAREKGLKEAEERTAALEKQIADMQKLLTLKNDAMLNAQEKSTQIAENKVAEAKSGDIGREATNEAASKDAETTAAQAASEVDTAAVSADVEKPKAEKPKAATPTKPVTAAEDKQPSFIFSLLDSVVGIFKQLDKMILGVVAALVALLLAGWLYFRNKRSKKLEDFEQGIMTSSSLKTSTIFGDTASGNINIGDTSFLTDFSQSTSNGLIDTNDVDPIAEAEVYMAYGRDEQAEEILKDAISKEPQRYELHLKLLEMYAANKNNSAFEAFAGEMYITLGADDPTWIKVGEIGRQLEPNNLLYQAKESTEQVASSESIDSDEDTRLETTLGEQDFSEKVLDASDFSDSPLAAEADLDFSDSESDAAEGAVVAGTTTDDVFDINNLSLEIANVDEVLKMDESAIQFDLDKPNDEAVAEEVKLASEAKGSLEKVAPSLDFPTLELQDQDEGVELNTAPAADKALLEATEIDIPNDLSLDMSEAEKAPAQNPETSINNAEAADDFDFGIDNDAPAVVPGQANVMDMSGISLDISDDGDNAPTKTTEADEVKVESESLTPVFEEVETKLELVAAYIDMEDKDGAKELLEEVLKEGNLSQRKRADQMLSSLA
jgi:pilus assembly protein FimV